MQQEGYQNRPRSSAYWLKYETRTAIKGQIPDNFITNFTLGITYHADQPEGWVMNVDGASNSKGARIRVVLTTPKVSIIEQSFTISFPASNNKAEYEAILAGL